MAIPRENEYGTLTRLPLAECAFDLNALGVLDAPRLSFARAHSTDRGRCQHMVCMVARSTLRRTPLGPPDTWLPRSPAIAAFAVDGVVKHCQCDREPTLTWCSPDTSPSSTMSITLVRRQDTMSRVRWRRIVDAIELVILRKTPGNADARTLYDPLTGLPEDMELYIKGRYTTNCEDGVCLMVSHVLFDQYSRRITPESTWLSLLWRGRNSTSDSP